MLPKEVHACVFLLIFVIKGTGRHITTQKLQSKKCKRINTHLKMCSSLINTNIKCTLNKFKRKNISTRHITFKLFLWFFIQYFLILKKKKNCPVSSRNPCVTIQQINPSDTEQWTHCTVLPSLFFNV